MEVLWSADGMELLLGTCGPFAMRRLRLRGTMGRACAMRLCPHTPRRPHLCKGRRLPLHAPLLVGWRYLPPLAEVKNFLVLHNPVFAANNKSAPITCTFTPGVHRTSARIPCVSVCTPPPPPHSLVRVWPAHCESVACIAWPDSFRYARHNGDGPPCDRHPPSICARKW